MNVLNWIIVSLHLTASPPAEVPHTCYKTCKISEAGVSFIREQEGYMPFPYLDPVGIRTVGHGHVVKPSDALSFPLLPAQADLLLRKDISAHEDGMRPAFTIALFGYQYDPIVSFAYNLGVRSLITSTLLKRVNAGQHSDVPDEFRRWVYAGGRKLPGLVKRREAEATMYAGPR